MATGRCVGCGETGPERQVRQHCLKCPDWARVYWDNPSLALDPVSEYLRWAAEDKPGERAAELEAKVADTDARRAALADRYRTRDILE